MPLPYPLHQTAVTFFPLSPGCTVAQFYENDYCRVTAGAEAPHVTSWHPQPLWVFPWGTKRYGKCRFAPLGNHQHQPSQLIHWTLPTGKILAALTYTTWDSVVYTYHAVLQDMAQGVSSSCLCTIKTDWCLWQYFTPWLRVCSDLTKTVNPVLVLQIFAHRFCARLLEATRRCIHKMLVNQHLFLIRKVFFVVGYIDPLLNSLGKIHFCLWCHLSKYQHEDSIPYLSLSSSTYTHFMDPLHPPELFQPQMGQFT